MLAEQVYLKFQGSFRVKRSTTDMIFYLRQLQGNSCEQRKPMYITFINLTKAFEQTLQIIGKDWMATKMLSFIISFLKGMQGMVPFDESSSEPFPIYCSMEQGCILAPTLFGIIFSLVLSYAFRLSEDGTYLYTRSNAWELRLKCARSWSLRCSFVI